MFSLFLVVLLTSTGFIYGQGTERDRRQTSEIETPGELCDRKCGDAPRICKFTLILERYSTLTGACGNCTNGVQSDCLKPQCIPAEGISRPMLSVNRTLPGPAIVVCQHDEVVVDVDNRMADLATSIHWHGIRQVGTPYMDGVPMVTQCPIPPSTSFRYHFNATDAGTYFYHSHSGPQKLDGLAGALIVRGVKSRELHKNLYDRDLTEHVIVIQDWLNTTAYYWNPGPHLPGVGEFPSNVLINGLGPFKVNVSNGIVPMARFRVQQGVRYRFRLIGASCMTCMYAITIQGHNLTVITTDGGLNVKPTVVQSICVNSGERFDFVLNATNRIDSYYIFVDLVTPFCGQLRQIAVLEYEGSNGLTTPPPKVVDFGLMLNPPDAPCNGSRPNQICVSQLSGEFNATAVSGTNVGYQQIPIVWGAYLYTPQDLFNSFDSYEEPLYEDYVRYTINNISLVVTPSPFLTQFSDIPESYFCGSECRNSTLENSCACANYYSIEEGTIVDLIVTDDKDTDFNHPFHLHGHNFFVLHLGQFESLDPAVVARTKQQLRLNLQNDGYSLSSRPQKDTVTVPVGGYAVLRFRADNPGWWMLHCHFVYHLGSGMAALFKVGTFKGRIPDDFPRCGNYLPRNRNGVR